MVICYMEIPLKILALYRVSIRSGKSEKVRKFVRGSEKVRELDTFWKKIREKSGKKSFNHIQVFNFNLHVEMCLVELYTTISSIYDTIRVTSTLG